MLFRINIINKTLLKHWNSIPDALQQKPNLFVINGETIDGANKKQIGQETWSTNLQDQMNDCVKLIDKILIIPEKNIKPPQLKDPIINISNELVEGSAEEFEDLNGNKVWDAINTESEKIGG